MQAALDQAQAELNKLRDERDQAQSIANTAGTLVTSEKAAQEKLAQQVKQLEADNQVLRDEINAEDVIKDELERRGRLMKDLAKILEHVRHTRVGSDISAKSIAEFKP